jgi:hypothetical protein
MELRTAIHVVFSRMWHHVDLEWAPEYHELGCLGEKFAILALSASFGAGPGFGHRRELGLPRDFIWLAVEGFCRRNSFVDYQVVFVLGVSQKTRYAN